MMNTKISEKHDNMHYIIKNYTLKYFYNNGNEYMNETLPKSNKYLEMCHL